MNKIFTSSRQFTSILRVLGIILLGITQVTLMPYLSIYGAWPNLILLLALVLIFLNYIPEAYLVASLGGLILDLGSPLFFGFYTLVIIFLVFMNKILIEKYLSDAPIYVVAIILGLNVVIFDLVLTAVAHQFFGIKMVSSIFYSIFVGLGFYQILCYQNRQSQFFRIKE